MGKSDEAKTNKKLHEAKSQKQAPRNKSRGCLKLGFEQPGECSLRDTFGSWPQLASRNGGSDGASKPPTQDVCRCNAKCDCDVLRDDSGAMVQAIQSLRGVRNDPRVLAFHLSGFLNINLVEEGWDIFDGVDGENGFDV